MRHDEARDDIWSLTSAQLALRCRSIADGTFSPNDKALQAEAGRLHAEWQAAIRLPKGDFSHEARRSALLLALRKRTIEILIKIGQKQ
jgi:hypothetical protein